MDRRDGISLIGIYGGYFTAAQGNPAGRVGGSPQQPCGVIIVIVGLIGLYRLLAL